MKNSFAILFTFLSLSVTYSQKYADQDIISIFNHINETDGANLNHPEQRSAHFNQNFDTIIHIIRTQGFPQLSEGQHKKKTIQSISSGAQRTFTHILQTQPERILNLEIIDLIQTEIEAGRLDNQLLKSALSAFQFDHDIQRPGSPEWTTEIEDNFYYAIRAWKIKLYPTKD